MLSVSFVIMLALFVGGYLCCFFLIPLVMKLAWLVGMVDQPGGRRHHPVPVPTGVGAAPLITTVIGLLVYAQLPAGALQAQFFTTSWIRLYLAGLLVVSLLGLFDDALHLSARVKLFGQIVAAVLLWVGGIGFGGELIGVALHPGIDFLATIFWVVLLINAYNLIDGFDGLATGLSIISTLGLLGAMMFRGLYEEAMVLSVFVGSLLAFLRFNASPARAFLGDTGSMFIGYSFAVFSLSTSMKGTSLVSLWLPILCFGVPLFDTFLAVWRRTARSILQNLFSSKHEGGIMAADVDHIHHRLVRAGLTPKSMNGVLYLSNSIVVLLCLVSLTYRNSWVLAGWLFLFLCGSAAVARLIAKTELRESGEVLVLVFSSTRSQLFARISYGLFDVVGAFTIYLGGWYLCRLPEQVLFMWNSFTVLLLSSALSLGVAMGLLDFYWPTLEARIRLPRFVVRGVVVLKVVVVLALLQRLIAAASLLQLSLHGIVVVVAFSIYSVLLRVLPGHAIEALALSAEDVGGKGE